MFYLHCENQLMGQLLGPFPGRAEAEAHRNLLWLQGLEDRAWILTDDQVQAMRQPAAGRSLPTEGELRWTGPQI